MGSLEEEEVEEGGVARAATREGEAFLALFVLVVVEVA